VLQYNSGTFFCFVVVVVALLVCFYGVLGLDDVSCIPFRKWAI